MRTLRTLLFLAIGLAVAFVLYIYASPTATSPGTVEQPRASAPQASEFAGQLLVPVAGVERAALTDTWGQTRGEGRTHQAIDIMAPGGTPVLAAMPGRVEKLFTSAQGGITAYVRSDDGRWIAYYAHLQGYAAGLAEGQRVEAGQLIGTVGDTGNSGAGNFHLHFALQRMAPGQKWYEGTAVNPHPILARNAPLR